MTRQFGDLIASELYCPKCRKSMPVRERLLLVLPSGELHEYLCADCSSSLGQRTVSGVPQSPAPNPAPRRAAMPKRLLR